MKPAGQLTARIKFALCAVGLVASLGIAGTSIVSLANADQVQAGVPVAGAAAQDDVQGAAAITRSGDSAVTPGSDGGTLPGESTGVSGSESPDQPTTPENPAGPSEPAVPGEPAAPVDPTEPADPAAPVNPAEPSEPTTPTDPTDPSQPTDPAEPIEPTDPTVPTESTQPGEPTKPAEPENPSAPDAPADAKLAGACTLKYYVVTPEGKTAYATLSEALVAAAPARASEGVALKVALDAAHDGEHAGTALGDLTEADLTLALAQQLARSVQDAQGLSVSSLRSSSQAIAPGVSAQDELAARIALAKEAGADLLLEVHANLAGGELACELPAAQDGLPVVVVELALPSDFEQYDFVWLGEAAAQMLTSTFNPADDSADASDAAAIAVASARSALADALEQAGDALSTCAATAPVKMGTATDSLAGEDNKHEARFPDTPVDSWYVQGGYIDYVVDNGLMSGYSADGMFGPSDGISREQVVTILYRYAKGSASSSTTHFSDVQTGQWYTAAVEWAYENGISTGYFATSKFGVGDPITREDFATMLYRFAQRCGKGSGSADISGFYDSDQVSEYATDAMEWANAAGILTGDTTTGVALLNPQAATTRAQAAKMITVLSRDVLAGATMQQASWSLSGLSTANAYLKAGSSTKATANVSGSGSGLTYQFAWVCSDGSTWAGDAGSSSSVNLDFDTPGKYTVYVKVTDAYGTAHMASSVVQVWKLERAKVGSAGDASWTVAAILDAPSTEGYSFKYTWKRGWAEGSATLVGSQMGGESLSVTLPAEDYYWFYAKVIDPEGHEDYRAQRILYAPSGKIGWQNPSDMYQVSTYNVSPHSPSRGILSYMTPSRIGAAATRQDCVEAFIARAYEYLGTSYVWNYACAPGVGVDCVGLVMQCCYAVGMDTKDDDYIKCFDPICHWDSGSDGWHSHDANNLWNYGKIQRISKWQMSRGDLVFWPGHVAIYLGNDQIIQALPSGGVYITTLYNSTNYNYDRISGVGRLFAK